MLPASITFLPSTTLRRRDYGLLFFLALSVAILVAALQPVPGYMDADYYYADGKQLASGHGFSDPFLWNYLDNPQGLPHPSNSYWYPLASLIAAGGMLLTGRIDFISARIGFVLMAALAPLVVTFLAYRVSGRRSQAIIAGLLTIFCAYYLPFIATTDNYSLYLLLGGLYFLLLDKLTKPGVLLLGILAGFLNLARGDGLIWLPFTLIAVTYLAMKKPPSVSTSGRILRAVKNNSLTLAGYLLVMGSWFVRNLIVFGTIIPPGAGYVLWMTSYNQLYSFTPQVFTFQSWLASGLLEVMKVRASALWQNLGTAFFAQGMIFLVPLIILGGWKNRHLFFVQFGFLGWLGIFFSERYEP